MPQRVGDRSHRAELSSTSSVLADVSVECFGLRLVDASIVGRRVCGPMVDDPDRVAARLIGLVGSSLDGVAVLHSTSWRWTAGGGIVLTYLCCPDPSTVHGEIVMPSMSHTTKGVEPSRPSSGAGTGGDVLHHGVDHFAWLADHFAETVGLSIREDPDLWSAIHRAGRHRAGRFGAKGSTAEPPRTASRP